MQPKGRIMTDAFIFKPRAYKLGKPKYLENQLWIDVDRSNKKALKDHLAKHMWRKKVQMIDVEEESQGEQIPQIYSGYNQENTIKNIISGTSIQLEQLESGENDTYANLVYFDPRGSKFGLRIVSSQQHISISGHFQQITEKQHQKIFEKAGQCPNQITANKLPFQFNYDLMNAISLKKGCYVGQQIISRGLLTGIIRRRTFPFVLQKSEQYPNIEINSAVKTENGEQIGKVVSYSEGQGIALINYLSKLQEGSSWPIKITHPAKGELLCPFQSKLQRYYQQMKGKQKIIEQLQL